MRRQQIVTLVAVMAVAFAATAAELAIEERAAGIAAVEQLRHGSRIGANETNFEQTFPMELWRARAQELGALLDRASDQYGSKVVTASLDREFDRMAAASRAPGRLDMMRSALNHDPATMRECLVLPMVAHRLDDLIVDHHSHPGADNPDSANWDWWVSPLVFENRQFHTAVWTGNEMIVWGGRSGDYLDTGGIYEPSTDTWLPTSLVDAPLPRGSHTAVWADGRMIVWGGYNGSYLDDGGRYDPATHAWSQVSVTDAPLPRAYHTAVWTGDKMIVWGGGNSTSPQGTGGIYDPVSNDWSDVTMTDAPWPRYDHVMIWTGSEAIVWGGATSYSLPPSTTNTGGRYDPAGDTWTATSTTACPSPRYAHVGVWTGSEMIIWANQNHHNTGGRYDVATDTWQATNTADAPEGRAYPSAVWTGSEMIVWGGSSGGGNELDTGGHYDPADDSWTPTTMPNAPEPSMWQTAVWTGTEMLVWGGYFENQLAGYGNNALVFEDGFESGDTGGWSGVGP